MAKLSKTKFKPRRKKLVNVILFLNILFFAGYAVNFLEPKLAIKLAVLFTVTPICFWFFWVEKFLVIEVTPDHVLGPAGLLRQHRIKIANVDLLKTRNSFYETAVWQRVSICSDKDKKILIFPFLFTQHQMRKMMSLIEDYRRAGPESIIF